MRDSNTQASFLVAELAHLCLRVRQLHSELQRLSITITELDESAAEFRKELLKILAMDQPTTGVPRQEETPNGAIVQKQNES
jgi:hypothetical protein